MDKKKSRYIKYNVWGFLPIHDHIISLSLSLRHKLLFSNRQLRDGTKGSKVHNSIFISRNSIIISRNSRFILRNSIFISRNSIFISCKPSYLYIWSLFCWMGQCFFLKTRTDNLIPSSQINSPVPISSTLSSTRLFFNMCSTKLTDHVVINVFYNNLAFDLLQKIQKPQGIVTC